jgi:hypothetical protein
MAVRTIAEAVEEFVMEVVQVMVVLDLVGALVKVVVVEVVAGIKVVVAKSLPPMSIWPWHVL